MKLHINVYKVRCCIQKWCSPFLCFCVTDLWLVFYRLSLCLPQVGNHKNILMKLHSNVYEVKTACHIKNVCSPFLSFWVTALWLVFHRYPCAHHNLVTIGNIWMKLNSHVYEVKKAIVCKNNCSPLLIFWLTSLWLDLFVSILSLCMP